MVSITTLMFTDMKRLMRNMKKMSLWRIPATGLGKTNLIDWHEGRSVEHVLSNLSWTIPLLRFILHWCTAEQCGVLYEEKGVFWIVNAVRVSTCHSWAGHVYTPRYDKLLTEHILLAGKQQVDRRLHFPDIEAMWQLAINPIRPTCLPKSSWARALKLSAATLSLFW